MQKIRLVLGGKAIEYHLPYFLYTRRWEQTKNQSAVGDRQTTG
ncbi:hypothetical protein GQ41_3340 [Arenibacter algicola]|uniref:Uncharacterized protein n=1 Tax=Arenibacter algicola TaxID=616991 RepID=A0ABY3AI12_9FLAO